jgi:hypothetical protein
MAGSGTADPKAKNETAGKLRAGKPDVVLWTEAKEDDECRGRAQRRADRVCVAASGRRDSTGEYAIR